MLARFDERAAGYDRENRFFDEDFAELRRSGYLDIAIPEKFGGPGLLLAEVLELQRRLAYVAPATALGVNMHLYFTGTAADLHRAGDSSCDCRCRVDETWDVLGMRATQSQDTFLDRVFVPDEYVPLVCPAGLKGAGLFHLGIFAWGLLGFPTVYAAIARRAYDLAIEGLPKRTSVAPDPVDGPPPRSAAPGSRHADGPGGRRPVPRTGGPRLVRRRRPRPRLAGQDHLGQALRRHPGLPGGRPRPRPFRRRRHLTRNRLERLFRDCRLGRIHPANDMLTHELVGKFSLGIDLDDPQRWG